MSTVESYAEPLLADTAVELATTAYREVIACGVGRIVCAACPLSALCAGRAETIDPANEPPESAVLTTKKAVEESLHTVPDDSLFDAWRKQAALVHAKEILGPDSDWQPAERTLPTSNANKPSAEPTSTTLNYDALAKAPLPRTHLEIQVVQTAAPNMGQPATPEMLVKPKQLASRPKPPILKPSPALPTGPYQAKPPKPPRAKPAHKPIDTVASPVRRNQQTKHQLVQEHEATLVPSQILIKPALEQLDIVPTADLQLVTVESYAAAPFPVGVIDDNPKPGITAAQSSITRKDTTPPDTPGNSEQHTDPDIQQSSNGAPSPAPHSSPTQIPQRKHSPYDNGMHERLLLYIRSFTQYAPSTSQRLGMLALAIIV